MVVQVDYPGASPEIVESEVTKKVEESLNTIAGINQLFSRTYEGTSVVNRAVQTWRWTGRRAADDVREKLSIVKASFRDEVKEPRVSRFDPAARPDLFHRPHLARQQPQRAAADHLRPTRCCASGWRTCAGCGSVTLVGGLKRELNVYVKPQGAGSPSAWAWTR